MAYDKSLNDHNLKNLIFYHIHNPDHYAKLNFVQSAPNANWVMMVREPYRLVNLGSEVTFIIMNMLTSR